MKCNLEQNLECINNGKCKFNGFQWACPNYRHYLANKKQKVLYAEYLGEKLNYSDKPSTQ